MKDLRMSRDTYGSELIKFSEGGGVLRAMA